ncbi:hypothetical protein [Daejeonia sp. YH14]|uniref:hypothetical protein n=1 Tax=Daejeonia sp. YH14 TaxID=3439042 RepID=UPI003F499CF7
MKYTESDIKDIHVHYVNDAIVLPLKMMSSGEKYGSGGVVSQDGQYIEASGLHADSYLRYGGSYGYDENRIKKIDEEVLHFWAFFAYWGHFLIELIGRMWYLVHHFSYQNLKVIYK